MTTESLDPETADAQDVLGEPITLRTLLHLVRDSLYHWNQAKAYIYSAALAFYTIFSIVPMVVFIVGITGRAAGAEEFEQRVVALIARQAGAVPAQFVGDIVTQGNANSQSALATGLGLLFLIYGASTVFHMLQNSINAMYGLPENYETLRHGILVYLTSRLLAALVVILLGVIFLLLVAANFFFAALPQTRVEAFFEGLGWTQFLVRYVVAPLVSTMVICAIYKWLPGGQIRWRDVLPGSAMTMVLISIGNRVVGFYLERLFQVSLYGASGSVILFLVWIYYISLILLFGAKFIALYAERFGNPITPKARLMHSRSHA